MLGAADCPAGWIDDEVGKLGVKIDGKSVLLGFLVGREAAVQDEAAVRRLVRRVYHEEARRADAEAEGAAHAASE